MPFGDQKTKLGNIFLNFCHSKFCRRSVLIFRVENQFAVVSNRFRNKFSRLFDRVAFILAQVNRFNQILFGFNSFN